MKSRALRFAMSLLLLCAPSAAGPGEDPAMERLRKAARMPEVRAVFKAEISVTLPFPGRNAPSAAEAAALRAAMTGDERDAERHFGLGRAAMGLPEDRGIEEAKEEFRKSIALYRKQAFAGARGADFRIAFAKALYEAHEWDEMQAQLREAVVEAPDDGRCWAALCCALQIQAQRALWGRPLDGLLENGGVSESAALQVLSKSPSSEQLARAVDLLKEARSCGDRAVAAGPRFADAYRARACIGLTKTFMVPYLAEAGSEAGMSEMLLAAKGLYEDTRTAVDLEPASLQDLGTVLLWGVLTEGRFGDSQGEGFGQVWDLLSESGRRRLEDGMAVMRAWARNEDPRIAAMALEFLGDFQMLRGEKEQAEKSLRECVALDPSRRQAWETLLIGMRQRADRPAEVAAACEARVKVDASLHNRLMLAKAYEELGEYGKAGHLVAQARAEGGEPARWDGDRFNAEIAMAALLLRRGGDRETLDHVKACLDLANKAVKSRPDAFDWKSIQPLLVTAGIYIALMGKPAIGEKAVREALRRDPFDRYAREVLLAIYGDRRPGSAAYPASADATVFADFESGTLAGWTVEGKCFGDRLAVTGRVRDQSPTSGERGLYFVDSSWEDDRATGKAISAPFRIEKRFIHFLVGGGNHPGRCCLDLVVDGKVVRSATGRNSGEMLSAFWDVGDLRGRTGRLEIVDAESGEGGHILVDQIVFAAHPDLAGAHFPRAVHPAEGTRRLLVILFDPHRPGHPAPERKTIENLLFGEQGSLRGWFAENSGGNFGVESAGVLGWYDARKPAEHYWKTEKEADVKDGDCWLRGANERLTEAVLAADADFDFAACDGNGDGVVTPDELAILVVIPHGEIPLGANHRLLACEDHGGPPVADGVRIPVAVEWMTGERLTFGTPAKELSEMLLGAVNLDNWGPWAFGAGSYSIMDWAGATGHMDPLLKLKLGWVSPVGVAESGEFDLGDVETRREVLVLYDPARGMGEYFLVENRWRGSSCDAGMKGQGPGIPADGLAVWHVIEDPALLERVEPPAPQAWRPWEGRGTLLVRADGGLPRNDGKALLSVAGAKLSDTTGPAHLRWIDGTPSGFEVELGSPPGPMAKVRIAVRR